MDAQNITISVAMGLILEAIAEPWVSRLPDNFKALAVFIGCLSANVVQVYLVGGEYKQAIAGGIITTAIAILTHRTPALTSAQDKYRIQ